MCAAFGDTRVESSSAESYGERPEAYRGCSFTSLPVLSLFIGDQSWLSVRAFCGLSCITLLDEGVVLDFQRLYFLFYWDTFPIQSVKDVGFIVLELLSIGDGLFVIGVESLTSLAVEFSPPDEGNGAACSGSKSYIFYSQASFRRFMLVLYFFRRMTSSPFGVIMGILGTVMTAI